MLYRIADTFTDSLARLAGEEQKAVKTTAFDLQVNPANPSLSFHKLDRAKDKNFWSVRVSRDIRIIVHKADGNLLLCYVDHHDDAYAWAERRKLETHPKTGAAQLVEIRESVREIQVPLYVQAEHQPHHKKRSPLFAEYADDKLLSYGVPTEWLSEVRLVDEESLLTLAERLPAEAAEALLELATGGSPRVTPPVEPETNPFDHPDAQRRFRVMTNHEELERALEYPWEKWTVFLHPEQEEFVQRSQSGPARVSGTAGTGKTIVALHRAVYLARSNLSARVLLATFSDTLAHALRTKLKRLIGNEPRLGERIDVHSLDGLGQRLHKAHIGSIHLVSRPKLRRLLDECASAVGDHRFSSHFLLTEWEQVVDAWQLESWDAYRDVVRLGRRTRLPESQREKLWSIFTMLRDKLAEQSLTTQHAVFTALASVMQAVQHPPFDFAVVDEAQDLSIAQLKFLAALAKDRPEALFFAGDLGQRIFQQPFSWKSLGVDIRGRSRNLRVNYRTSHQIRQQADRLLGPDVADADGNRVSRHDTISVFNGPPPEIQSFDTEEAEMVFVSSWLKKLTESGLLPQELGIFVRSEAQLDRAITAVTNANLPYKVLDEHLDTTGGHASISTMHLAKGLEFRVVVVMACDDEVIPLQERIESIGDDADLQEAYDTERHLLYVACTRARDQLLLTSLEPASEFLDDLLTKP